jgi:hypothetical protein
MPWAERILPAVEELAAGYADRTISTCFIPAASPGAGPGMWSQYYRRWADMTLERIHGDLVDLMPPLKGLVPLPTSSTNTLFAMDGRTAGPVAADETNRGVGYFRR